MPIPNIADRVQETTTATSAATISLAGAVGKFRTFASAFTVGMTNIPICMESAAGDEEGGYYTLTSAGVLTQTARHTSTNGGAAVTFPAGDKIVYCALTSVALNDLVSAASSSAASGIRDIAFAQSVNLSVAGQAFMPQTTVSGSLTFTPAASPVRGALVYLRLIADGVNAPNVSAFKEWGGSSGYVNTAGIVNEVQFFYDGYDYWFSASQAVNATAVSAGGTATVSGVTVSPSTAAVAGGGTQTYTATVAGTNSPGQTVTWSASAGSITSGGAFTAPAATSSAQTITITATSTVDGTKAGTATATIAATAGAGSTVTGVTVSPSAQSVVGTFTQQFSATVAGTNSPLQTVTWGATIGTINSSGLYTAPTATGSAQTATITATSTQDGTKSGTTTVTIPVVAAPGAPTIGTAVAGDGFVDVAFTPSASNGGAPITLRTATLSTGETATGTTSPIRVPTTTGVARTAHVTATNSAGLTGPVSAESNSVTPTVAAAVDYPRMNPANLTSTVVESGSNPYIYTGTTGTTVSTEKGGVLLKTLPANTDGYVEFTIPTVGDGGVLVGFRSVSTPGTLSGMINAAFYTSGTGPYYYRKSGGANLQAGAATDTLRVGRFGGTNKAQIKVSGGSWVDLWTDIATTAQYWIDVAPFGTAQVQLLNQVGLS